MNDNDVFLGHGVEITLENENDFLKVKETLTRIGISSKKDKILYQSCHILHKQGRYAILHFKELFLLDGKTSTTFLDEDDIARRNTITNLLAEWKLLKIKNTDKSKNPVVPISSLKIIPFREKNEWELVAKYTIGKKKVQ